MSFLLRKAVVNASQSAARQWQEVQLLRRVANNQERHLAGIMGIQANAAAVIGPQFWLDLDRTTVELIGQEADPLFTDLMALSRSVNIGKLVAAYRRLGPLDAGETSLNGQLPKLMGSTSADYDGVVIPIHSKAFGRQWREVEGQRSMGYDDLADDQQGAVREVMRLMTENFMNGKAGLNYQGFQSTGLRNSPNVLAVQLAADFTDPDTTFAEMQAAFVAYVSAIRAGNNRVTSAGTVYISPEIEQNLQRTSGATTFDRNFWMALAETAGVAEIKTSYLLEGNEMLFIVRNRQFIQPVTGMAITTTPIPRNDPFADHQMVTWAASGLQIRADAEGRTGVAFGTS